MRKFCVNVIDTRYNHVLLERFSESKSIRIDYAGEDHVFGGVMSSDLVFTMLNETAVDGRYLDLITGEERRYVVEVKEIIKNGALTQQMVVWRGFLLPDVYAEPYKNVSFFVSFTATDGLGVLKSKPFIFYKTGSLIKMLAHCLLETGLYQDIYFAPAIENAFYSWEDVQLFSENFREVRENNGEVVYEDCYTVLEYLLKAVGATLYQEKGVWMVVGYNQKHRPVFDYVRYNSFGDRVSVSTYVRNVSKGVFNTGLGVQMAMPFKTVQANVSYKKDESDLFPEEFVQTKDFTSEDYNKPGMNASAQSVQPLKYWINSGGAKRSLDSEDNTTYLSTNVETVGSQIGMHPSGSYPTFFRKPPFYTVVYTPTFQNVNFSSDYITLKNEYARYVSSQVVGKPLELDIDVELRASSGIDENKFKEDYYSKVFRLDVLLGDTVVMSTDYQNPKYDSLNLKTEFKVGQNGSNYYWYNMPDFTTPAHVVARYGTPNNLVGTISVKGLKTTASGKLNVRLYSPRNGNAQNGGVYNVVRVAVVKLEVKVKAWDSESYKLTRGITYTTSKVVDLRFSDGKNDLYDNLFKIREREDYINPITSKVLATSFSMEDDLYYYITFPGSTAGGIIEDFKAKYSGVKLHKGTAELYLHYIFGDIDSQAGLFISGNSILFSKSRINEFPYLRDLFVGFSKITVPDMYIKPVVEDVEQQKYVSWKRYGENVAEGYLANYAKMIHECRYRPSVVLDGVCKRLVFPSDMLEFKYLDHEDKLFIPTRVSIDLATGNTSVVLAEAVHKKITDYVFFN